MIETHTTYSSSAYMQFLPATHCPNPLLSGALCSNAMPTMSQMRLSMTLMKRMQQLNLVEGFEAWQVADVAVATVLCCWQFVVSERCSCCGCVCVCGFVSVLDDKFSILQPACVCAPWRFRLFSHSSAQHIVAYDWCRLKQIHKHTLSHETRGSRQKLIIFT